MKSKLNILVMITLMSISLSADYEELKAYKAQIKMQPHALHSSRYETQSSYFILDFKDINQMDTFVLKERYALKLSECIADGICIFQFLNSKTQQLPITEILQNETNIRSVKAYKSYEFQAF